MIVSIWFMFLKSCQASTASNYRYGRWTSYINNLDTFLQTVAFASLPPLVLCTVIMNCIQLHFRYLGVDEW